ncbi:BTAD domain-containing putative transcriptional regulator [Streptomyces cyaneofuscatus]|uniref:AfsR/SARP family transcriptional regulator n=1 Tax=Streptomyces cyaneofuscatus TaxID=66883 RepID=UPI0037F3FF59
MEFRILGPLELSNKGAPLKVAGSKRQAVLGALLLADGSAVNIDRLIEAVWGTEAPTTAAKQIRNAISDLRRLHAELGERIGLVGDGYRLELDGCHLDARVFACHVAEARKAMSEERHTQALESLRAAIALWRGPVLDGLERRVLEAQATGLNELRLASMEQRGELELAQGNHQGLLSELSVWVAENPLRERLVAQFMVALHRSGAQASALEVFDRTRRTLREELGVNHGAELREAHRYILRGGGVARRVETAGVRHNNLPAGVAHFTGRVREKRIIREASGNAQEDRENSRAYAKVIAIDGMAGIGKTTLAVQAAHELAPFYPDGQLFADLRAYTTSDRSQSLHAVLGTLLSGLGVAPEAVPPGVEDRIVAWRRLLLDRRALIVLDNVADTTQVTSLLPTAPGCLTLVTSRKRLMNLSPTHQLTLQGLSPHDGRVLFAKIAGDDRPRREPDAAERVLRLCAGLPLAIRLAATRLRHRPSWTASHLAARLASGGQWMSILEAENSSLAEVFRQSYEGLNPAEQRMFRLLGRMPRSRIEARRVAALVGLSVIHTSNLLESLVDSHVLSATGPASYQLHELLHSYAGQLDGGACATGDCLVEITAGTGIEQSAERSAQRPRSVAGA